MKKILFLAPITCFLLNGEVVVDKDKFFTSSTIITNPAIQTPPPDTDNLFGWGHIQGGSQESPIILTAQTPLYIQNITSTHGSFGIYLDSETHATLKGDWNFSTIKGQTAAYGIFADGTTYLNLDGNITFAEIEGLGAVGIANYSLVQRGNLHLKSIKGRTATGIASVKLSNQASITIDQVSSQETSMGIFVLSGENQGHITINQVQSDLDAIGINTFTLTPFQNTGEILIKEVRAQNIALGFDGTFVDNQSRIQVQSVTSEDEAYGFFASKSYNKSLKLGLIGGKNKAVGFNSDESEVSDLQASYIISLNKALGIAGGFVNRNNTIFENILAGQSATGISNSFDTLIMNASSTMTFKKIGSLKQATGILGHAVLVQDSHLVFEEIVGDEATGIRGGNLTLMKGSKITFNSIKGQTGAGIFLDQSLSIDGDGIIHFQSINNQTIIDTLKHDLILDESVLIIAGNDTVMTQPSAIYSNLANAKFFLKGSISTQQPYAFYAQSDAFVNLRQDAKLSLDSAQYSLGGKIYLNLDKNSKLSLETGGNITKLDSNFATINLSSYGYSKALQIQNFQAQNTKFLLGVDAERNQSSNYDGGMVFEVSGRNDSANGNTATKDNRRGPSNNSGNLGKSKENLTPSSKGVGAILKIQANSPIPTFNNTLALKLQSKQNLTQKVFVLAQITGKYRNSIVFNSLKNGEQIFIQSDTSGYAAKDLQLGRYDDVQSNSNYYYLILNPYKDEALPPRPQPTPPSPPQTSTTSNLTAPYGALQGLFFSSISEMNQRFNELQKIFHKGGMWGNLSAEFWRLKSTSNNSFVGLQVGGDYLISFLNGRNFIGAALGFESNFFDRIDSQTSNTLNFNNSILAFTLYDSLIMDKGIYANTMLKVGGITNSANLSQHFWNNETSKDSYMLAFSEQIGYRFFFDDRYFGTFLDISGSVALGYINGISAQLKQNTWFNAPTFDFTLQSALINQNRIDILVGYQSSFKKFVHFSISAGIGTVRNHFAKGGMLYTFKDGNNTQNVNVKQRRYGFGISTQVNAVLGLGKRFEFFAHLSNEFGKNYTKLIKGSIGITVKLGPNLLS